VTVQLAQTTSSGSLPIRRRRQLYHFLPGTPVVSFGTAGCNLTCKFCQNWDISKSRWLRTALRVRRTSGRADRSKSFVRFVIVLNG